MKLPKWPLPSGKDKIELGLERMQKLLEKLGNPEKNIPPVFHVAGTNGKGSVTSFLKYIFEKGGYKVHRYTSPHLVNFNERIEIAGEVIKDEYYEELAEECKCVIEKFNLEASYFEIITAVAFLAFARNKADVTVLEVGLGGRLDATNVIDNPLVSIITSISRDHMKQLGNALSSIAMEKVKIVKPGFPVVISLQPQTVENLLKREAKKLSSPAFVYDAHWKYKMTDENTCLYTGFGRNITTPLPSLLGVHQIINAGTAISAILCQNKIPITNEAIIEGVKNTTWRGRLQKIENTILNDYLEKGTLLYLDGAHNEGGARVLGNWLDHEDYKEMRLNIIIISILERKDSKSFIKNIRYHATMAIIVDHHVEEGETNPYKDSETFKKELEAAGYVGVKIANSVQEALKMTWSRDRTKILKRVVICGSLYFIGEVLEIIEN
ncbi:MAG: bifunctional folylpolyglutamate synthase/dihydrofolate synthase [Rickettsiales bacterium]|jgi:dihydrofolate synthase/folylpolyglutamate synthase|nr:bifunctional folylpolyglutamate synthase/dihydrofolate synthase [Rickettsiales bacterium]